MSGDERRPLGRAMVWTARLVENSLSELGLTTQQYLVMDLLAQLDRPAAKLASGLQVTPGTVTALVDRLVKRGLIERSPDPDDRRRVIHTLTDDGRQLLRDADTAVAEAFGRWSQRLGASEEETLEAWAISVTAALDAAVAAQLARQADADP